jgi:DNA-binding transcriptional MerR regulator
MDPSPLAGDALDIGVVAEQSGLAPSALRYYERLGLIEPNGRNGHRRTYHPTVLDRLALIATGRATGFSLGQMRQLLEAAPADVRSQLREKVDDLEQEISSLQQARGLLQHALTCEHESMLECPTFRSGLRAMSIRRPGPDEPSRR